jgi:hypothetical protein
MLLLILDFKAISGPALLLVAWEGELLRSVVIYHLAIQASSIAVPKMIWIVAFLVSSMKSASTTWC